MKNRARFVLDVSRAVADAIGAARTGIRLSPWGVASDMPHYPESDDTYAYLAAELQKIGIVYIHLVNHESMGGPAVPPQTVNAIRRTFTNTLILSSGLHTAAAINDALDNGHADLVAVGRPFIANPDFVERLRAGTRLAAPDPATFYAPGPNGFADGYIDYPKAAA